MYLDVLTFDIRSIRLLREYIKCPQDAGLFYNIYIASFFVQTELMQNVTTPSLLHPMAQRPPIEQVNYRS
jgi:hypothetical protein